MAQINWTPCRGCSCYGTTHRYTNPFPTRLPRPVPPPLASPKRWSVSETVQSVGKLQQTFPLSHRATAETQDSARSQIPVALLLTPVTPCPSPPAVLPWPQPIQAACAALAAEAESVSRALKTPTLTSDRRAIDRRMRPERSLTDTHAPRGSLHPAPCSLPYTLQNMCESDLLRSSGAVNQRSTAQLGTAQLVCGGPAELCQQFMRLDLNYQRVSPLLFSSPCSPFASSLLHALPCPRLIRAN